MAGETTKDKRKRRLRAPSETLRERSDKIQQASLTDTPRRRSAFISGFTSPLRVIGRSLGKLGHIRIFRWIGLVLLPPYFRKSWRELRLVTWPNRRQSLQLTSAVVIFSIIFGVIIAGLDFVLDKLFKQLILK